MGSVLDAEVAVLTCCIVAERGGDSEGQDAVTWRRPSVSVCWCPWLAMVIVTHLVSRSLAWRS